MKASVKDGEVMRPARNNAPASLFFLCSTNLETDRRGGTVGGGHGLELDLPALARGLANSPAWREMPEAVLVVRRTPTPILGVVGRFDAAAEARLTTLGPQLAKRLASLRYVSYQRAEEDCERLANLLIERFGRDELRKFRFAAVPRGGLVVLGMLSYMLGLVHSQLEPPYPPDAPLVVVDDCALSGFRFDQFLARSESSQVIFAHLYSHPQLRAAVEAREPRVIACVGARDLYDQAPEILGAEYHVWRENWLARLGDDSGYWLGQPEHLCFPWNEPDVSVWNTFTERIERGWRIVPPEFCLKNRPAPGTESIPVQVQPEGVGSLRPSEQVLFGEFEGSIVVGNMQTKASYTLAGVAADMWKAVIEHGSLDEAALSLSEVYDVDQPTLQADLGGFVKDLLGLDLLEHSDE